MYKPSEQNAIRGTTAGQSKASWAYSNVPTFTEYKHMWIPKSEEAALQGCCEHLAARDGEVLSQAPEQP